MTLSSVIQIRDIRSDVASLLINSFPGAIVENVVWIKHNNIDKISLGYDDSITCKSLVTTDPLQITEIQNGIYKLDLASNGKISCKAKIFEFNPLGTPYSQIL